MHVLPLYGRFVSPHDILIGSNYTYILIYTYCVYIYIHILLRDIDHGWWPYTFGWMRFVMWLRLKIWYIPQNSQWDVWWNYETIQFGVPYFETKPAYPTHTCSLLVWEQETTKRDTPEESTRRSLKLFAEMLRSCWCSGLIPLVCLDSNPPAAVQTATRLILPLGWTGTLMASYESCFQRSKFNRRVTGRSLTASSSTFHRGTETTKLETAGYSQQKMGIQDTR